MADPNEATIQNMIGLTVRQYISLRGWGGTDSPNLVGTIDSIDQALAGDYIPESQNALRTWRGAFSGLIATTRSVLDPMWLAYGKLNNYPEGSPEAIIGRLYTDFNADSKDVNSRSFTFGAVSAGGSNVGSGTILRLTKDRHDFDTEAVTPDTKTFRCIADQHSNANEHEEAFEVRGQHEDRDGIIVTGSGQVSTAVAVSANDSAAHIENPSFDTLDGAVGSLTSIPGWVPSSLGNFDLNTTIYRDYVGAPKDSATPPATIGYSLKLSADGTIQQNLDNRSFTNPLVGGVLAPMHLQVAWNGTVGTAVDGTITLTLGSKTATVAVAQSGWQVLMLGPGDENWFDEWNQEDPLIKIEWSSRTSGYLLFDDIIFTPYQFFDGCWWLPVGGVTPFLREDVFTFADSISSDSKIQRAIAELYGMYLPHVDDASETWSDPS